MLCSVYREYSLSLSAASCESLYVTLVCSLLPCSLVAGLKGKCFPVAGTDQINQPGLSDTSNVLFAIPLPKLTLLLLFFCFFPQITLHLTSLGLKYDCMCNFLFEIARISSCIFAFSQHGFFESAAAQIKAEFHIKKKKALLLLLDEIHSSCLYLTIKISDQMENLVNDIIIVIFSIVVVDLLNCVKPLACSAPLSSW